MEGEASPRERLKRRAVAPVQRQEAAGLAGSGVRHPGPLDDDWRDAPPRQEIGYRRADHAAANDNNPHYTARYRASAGGRR